ncbi:glucosidase 2 subunit beta [Diachasma alloeum]|uniref:glucosidase 2 subunit beta n=1 Tax=Diachasma alloeum TaxID=454923 RepID=UPI0007384F55|nr:glucosidase 2 subunit beta [Diachasma alloeum]
MLNYFLLLTVSAVVLSLELSHVAGTQVPRPRGVPISKASLYSPERDFECLDGSRKILFHRVNDDYCDCGDGSDEPGTAACSNGHFYCQNAGFEAQYIPSSRVNDGVCDCCDTSDEYASGAKCLDNCHELGREARAEAEKAAEEAKAGNQIRLEMCAEGKKLKEERASKLAKLKGDYEEAKMIREEKENIKNQVEERERAALEKYKPVEPEPKEEPKEEAREIEAEEYFRMVDSDESGTVTVAEIQTRVTFDRDGNGVVTEEEAMYFLGNRDEVNLEEFLEKSWENIKPFLMRERGAFLPPSQPQDQGEDHPEDHPDDEDHDSDDHEDDLDHEDEAHHEEVEKDPEPEPEPEVKYDEETQALVNEANEARTHYQQAEKNVMDIGNEIRDLEAKVERDYGPDEVFATLDGQCFKLSDLEYVYSLCLYGKATQSAKSGGSEVSLGQWSDWTGVGPHKYTQMKFDRGHTCWNGPARTVTVNLRCGKENKLISASEPNRCEYAMIFTTPALCDPNAEAQSNHDEL